MMTMPPTSSDSATTPTSTVAMPAVACWKMPSTESEATMAKSSCSPGAEMAGDAQGDARLVLGGGHLGGLPRLDHQCQRLTRAEQLLVTAERDDHELVERVAEEGALLGADADDAERHPRDLDELVERILGPEQPIGHLPADQRDRAVALHLDRAHHPAALGVEGRELQVVVGHALDGDRLQLLAAIADGRVLLRLGHHRGDGRPEALDRSGLVEGDAGVVALAVDLVLVAGDAGAADGERVGTRDPRRWRRTRRRSRPG